MYTNIDNTKGINSVSETFGFRSPLYYYINRLIITKTDSVFNGRYADIFMDECTKRLNIKQLT